MKPAGGGRTCGCVKTDVGQKHRMMLVSPSPMWCVSQGAASATLAAGKISFDSAWGLRALEGKQTVGGCLMLVEPKVRRQNQKFIHTRWLGRPESPTYLCAFML